jgi:predicted flavoprotein YhiN
MLGYPRGSKELIGPFNTKFGPAETYEWFSKEAGIALKTEGDGRVFPVSDQSSTVTEALIAEANKNGVRIFCKTRVSHVTARTDDETFVVTANAADPAVAKDLSQFVAKKKDKSGSGDGAESLVDMECDRVVFATGSSR